MAYCDRCGSYIPDGWTSCPACGYDPEHEAAQQQAAQAQAHREEQEKYAREEAEKRRAQRQAYDKVWAENEQRRRKEEEEYRRRQQEQEERSRKERERHSREQSDNGVNVTVDPDGTKNVRVGDKERYYDRSDIEAGLRGEKVKEYITSDTVNKAGASAEKAVGKLIPILSYIGPLCFIPLILGKDHFTGFHARQGLRLFIWGAILQAVGGFFGISWAVGIFQVLMAIIGIKNVVNDEEKKLPYIGG